MTTNTNDSDPKFSASGILNALEHRLHDKYPVVQSVTDLFCAHLQLVLDELEKVSDDSLHGQAGFAQRYLLIQFINDLLIGFHLARQGYSKQAFCILRSPFENADLIELFARDPTQVQYWIEGGKVDYEELSPAKVRKKLGLDKNSPMEQLYHLLSELGAHPGFMSSKNHAAKEEKSQTVHVWLGGIVFEHSFLLASFQSFLMTLQLWRSFDTVYKDQMKPGDFSRVVRLLVTNMETFSKSYPNFFGQDVGTESLADIVARAVQNLEQIP